ncbi:MAG: NAD(P)H-dependent oxidoreductase [Leptonema sp. (in: bacteria)]
MKVTIISGSSRENSNSLRVAKALENLLKEIHNTTIIDFRDCDIPPIGRNDLKKNELSQFQSHFVNFLEISELIFFCIPEYNWTTNPEIINALHQMGREEFKDCFENKVFSIVGVSSGRGGRRPAIELSILLNKIISFNKFLGIVSPLILESHETDKNLDSYGNFLNPVTKEKFKEYLNYTLKITKKWHNR